METVTVEGLEEAKQGIRESVSRIIPLMLKMSIEAGVKTSNVAKGVLIPKKGVDTGALQASIHHYTSEWTNTRVKETIQAGSDAVSRGVSPYETSVVTKELRSVKATSEYAQAVEKKFRYMGTGFDYLKVEMPKLLDRYLQRLFKKM